MWKAIDDTMSLKECSIYSYSPDDYSSDTDDGAIWSLHYFFFNRQRKRVCYLYLRAIPILSHIDGTLTPTAKRAFGEDEYDLDDDEDDEDDGDDHEEEDLEEEDGGGGGGGLSGNTGTRYWNIDDATTTTRLQQHRREWNDSEDQDQFPLSDGSRSGSNGNIRAMSEEIADSMEV